MMTERTYTAVKKAVRTLDEHKGRDIVCLDLTGIHSYLENFVIVTGSSRIHCRALARAVSDLCTELGREKKNIPSDPGGWIVLDYGDIVFHIFIEEQRDYYNLERLWSDAERVDIGIEPGRGYVQSL